jgi:hypothetical protein
MGVHNRLRKDKYDSMGQTLGDGAMNDRDTSALDSMDFEMN